MVGQNIEAAHQDGSAPPVPHGGDLSEARRVFPHAPEPWIDLSTGINPVSFVLPTMPDHLWARLPARSDADALEAAAAQAFRAAPHEVMAAPGTQALIEMLPRLRAPGRVGIVGPTYGEHARSWRKHGHAVVELASLEHATDSFDVLVVTNPNNPDGRITRRPELERRAASLVARGGLLVVDEAFIDLESQVESLAPARPAGVLVLRSFGKAYGLAGARLGFAVAEAPLAAALRNGFGPWAVSGPALAIGAAAYADRDWLARAAEARAGDMARLDALLSRWGDTIGRVRLFRLLATPHAAALFDRLGRAGIWVRRFPMQPRWLRFGLPGSPEAWSRLEAALAHAPA